MNGTNLIIIFFIVLLYSKNKLDNKNKILSILSILFIIYYIFNYGNELNNNNIITNENIKDLKLIEKKLEKFGCGNENCGCSKDNCNCTKDNCDCKNNLKVENEDVLQDKKSILKIENPIESEDDIKSDKKDSMEDINKDPYKLSKEENLGKLKQKDIDLNDYKNKNIIFSGYVPKNDHLAFKDVSEISDLYYKSIDHYDYIKDDLNENKKKFDEKYTVKNNVVGQDNGLAFNNKLFNNKKSIIIS